MGHWRSRPQHFSLTRAVFPVFILCMLAFCSWPYFAAASIALQDGSASVFNPRLGTFYYKIDWRGMPIAHAAVTVTSEAAHYRITVHSGVDGLVQHLYGLNLNGEGKVSQDDFRPLESVFRWRKGVEERTTSVFFRNDGEIDAVQTETRDGRNPKKTVHSLQGGNDIFDLFSAMVFARTFDWRAGLSECFEVFTGKKTYQVTLNCIGEGIFEEGGERIKAWVLAPAMIDAGKAAEAPRLTSSRIYLSADDSRDILKIKTKIGIGQVEARLKKFEPQPS